MPIFCFIAVENILPFHLKHFFHNYSLSAYDVIIGHNNSITCLFRLSCLIYFLLVLSRLASGEWSAPSAVAVIGLQYGFLAGADLTDYILILNSDDAIRTFAGLGQFTLGGEVDVSE